MNIPMSDEEKRAILAQLLHIETREDYPQPNITVKEYMEMEGIDRVTAYGRLKVLVDKGILKKASGIKVGRRAADIYWAASLESLDTPPASDE